MKQMKRILSVILCLVMLSTFLPMMQTFAWSGGGIRNNGLGGIYIDIYKHPYIDSRWGAYGAPYGEGGCTWFVGARVMELTGKGSFNTQVGNTWYYTYGPGLGFTSNQTPSGNSVICWSGHIAILEKIEGSTAYISEGGHRSYPGNDYCSLSTCDVSSIPGRNSGFIGYVHFGSVNQDPRGDLDFADGGNGTVTVRGWAFDPDAPSQSIDVHIYIGGSAGQSTAEGHAIKADQSSPDVNSTYGITGKHRFSATLKTSKVGTVKVYAYAINNVSGNNPEIWDSGRTVTITKHTHSYTSKVTKAATCIATGVKTFTCSCGDSYTESLPINTSNHVNTKTVAATTSTCAVKGYTAGVYCNDCKKYISGHTEQPLADHSEPDANGNCTVCGQHIKDVTPTQPDDQDQTNTSYCRWCGKQHGGFFGVLTLFFHTIFVFIFGARY